MRSFLGACRRVVVGKSEGSVPGIKIRSGVWVCKCWCSAWLLFCSLWSLIAESILFLPWNTQANEKQWQKHMTSLVHHAYGSSARGIRFSGAWCARGKSYVNHSWFHQLKWLSPFGSGGRRLFYQHNQGITTLHVLPGEPSPSMDERSLCVTEDLRNICWGFARRKNYGFH